MQRFLAPEIVAEGVIKQKGTINHDEHLITRQYLHQNVINSIHADSANYLEVVADGGVNKLKVKPLTITDTTVDSTNSTLADFVSNVYTGTSHQEGDIVILSSASPVEAYVHNGGTAGTAADWDQINSGLSDAQIRALFSAGTALTYNATTGQYDVVQDDIRGMFSAGTGLALSAGQYSLDATSDEISEGTSNLFYTNARVNAHLSGGTGIGYADGVISLDATSDDLTEGTSNLFYTNARVDAHLSGGSGITYTAGAIALDADTDLVSEGTSNLYFTEQRVIDTLGVTTAGAEDVQLLTLSADGDFSVLLSDVFAEFSAGTGLSFDGGEYSLAANTDDVPESANPTNKYFTDSRARDAVSAATDAGNLLEYTASSGEFKVMISNFRKSFTNQNLSANTALNLTHNLGERLVHVSAMDGSGNAIELERVYTNNNTVQVKSAVALTGIDIVVSV